MKDSDLDDLLSNQETNHHQGGGANTQNMNLDHLTQTGIRVSPRNKTNHRRRQQEQMTCCDFITSYTIMLCHYYPKCCGCLMLSLLLVMMLLLTNFVFNPVQELGVVDDHHFDIHSKYDLTIGKVDHWCLRGGNDRCRCEDPLQPLGRMEHLSWVESVKANRLLLDPAVDVAILGESVVEAMGGRWMSKTRSSQMGALGDMFRRKFSESGLTGVALGVAGDTAPNVLWRLLHGEMPDSFQPKIWWVSLGMNDLARMGCSEEIVILGILRVVEEIMEKRPQAHIVINSVLPMANVRGGAYPLVSDYSEALKPPRDLVWNAPHTNNREANNNAVLLFPATRRTLQNGKKGSIQTDITDPKQREKYMAEKAEQIEQDRDRKNKKRWKRRDPSNAKLDDRHNVRKYAFGGKAFNKVPMWTSIQAINRQLRKFTEMPENKRVHYFDATDLFVDRSKGNARVKGQLITLTGYPRQKGFEIWEDAIVQYSKQILAEDRPVSSNNTPEEEEDDYESLEDDDERSDDIDDE